MSLADKSKREILEAYRLLQGRFLLAERLTCEQESKIICLTATIKELELDEARLNQWVEHGGHPTQREDGKWAWYFGPTPATEWHDTFRAALDAGMTARVIRFSPDLQARKKRA